MSLIWLLIMGKSTMGLMIIIPPIMFLNIFIFQSSFLVLLLFLEIAMIFNFFIMLFLVSSMSMIFFALFFSMAVSEASVGLSILVFMNRNLGNDNLKRF